MAESSTGAGKVEDELECLVVPEIKEVLKQKDVVITNGYHSQPERACNGQQFETNNDIIKL